jgi:hypothetical protein
MLVVFELVRQLRSKQLMAVRMAAVAVSVGALVGALALLISSGDPSIGGHQASLSQSLNLLLAHPFGLGTGVVGPRATRFANSGVLTESFFLVIALEAGVLALVCYIGVMIAAGVTLMRARLASGTNNDLIVLGVAAMAASVPSQLVLPTLQDGAVSWLLWLIVAVSISQCLRVARARRQRDRNASVTVVPAEVA